MSITLMTPNSFHFSDSVNSEIVNKYKLETTKSIDVIKQIIREKIKGDSILDKFYFLEGRTGSGKSTYLVSELYKEFIENSSKGSKIYVVEPKVTLTQSNSINIVRNNSNIIIGNNIGYLSGNFKVYPTSQNSITFMTTEIFKQKLLNSIDKQKKDADIVILDEVHILDIPMISLINTIYECFKLVKNNPKLIDKIPLFIFTSATINIYSLVSYFIPLFNVKSIKDIYENHLMIGYVIGKSNFPVKTLYLKSEISSETNKDKYVDEFSKWLYKEAIKLADDSKSTIKNSNSELIPCRDILVFFPVTKFYQPISQKLTKLIKEPLFISTNKSELEDFNKWRDNNRGKKRYVVVCYASGYSQLSEELLKYPIDPDRESNKNEIKIILTTPAIETGKTIATLYICIDIGLQFNQIFSPLNYNPKVFYGKLNPISKKSVIQRMGRVGREAEGVFIAYYTKKSFEMLDEDTTPDNINTVSMANIYADNFKLYRVDKLDKRLDVISKNNYIIPNSIDTLIKTTQDLMNTLYVDLTLGYTNINNIEAKCEPWLIYAKYLYYTKGYSLFNALFLSRLNRKFLPAMITPLPIKFKFNLDAIDKFDNYDDNTKREIIASIGDAKMIVNLTKYNPKHSLFIKLKSI